jgi:hypothetical protein
MLGTIEIGPYSKRYMGNWTAVTGTLPENVSMTTVAHWEDGKIAEEYLFM